MANVFILQRVTYDYYRFDDVIGVFTTRNNAIEYIKTKEGQNFDNYKPFVRKHEEVFVYSGLQPYYASWICESDISGREWSGYSLKQVEVNKGI